MHNVDLFDISLVGVPPLLSLGAVDPAVLTPAAEKAIADLLIEGTSSNTLASYRSALRYWAAWFAYRYGQTITLPVHQSAVLQFIVDHAQRTQDGSLVHELPLVVDAALVKAKFKERLGPMKLTTLVHRISVLSKIHQIRSTENPCQSVETRNLMARIRRAHAKRGDLAISKPALTREPLQAMLATCDDSLRGKRDRAVLLLAWASGGRRRSELSSMEMSQLHRIDDHFCYDLVHSKNNQAGVDRPSNRKPILGSAAEALRQWLSASGIDSGPIFRRIRRGNKLGEPLSAAAVCAIVKKRCALAGLNEGFSAHSLRSGFVTEASRSRVPLGDIMALTGHASIQTVMRYVQIPEGSEDAVRLAMAESVASAAK